MPLSLDQLRSKYLNFFNQKQHAIVPSAPLVPENDATTLFISSGMQPLLEYFLGAVHPLGSRVVNSQKCFRSQDIEEVGDNRHTTYFEMLGNWSFGDYFKTEQIQFVFEFLTNELNLDPARLFVTVFSGSTELNIAKDEEAIAAWQQQFSTCKLNSQVVLDPSKTGLGEGRICVYQWENWWSRAGKPSVMPVGEPGGPDSEIFYDFGADRKFHENSKFKDLPCHLNCDCGRFMEIGNSVFMQYIKQADGSFVELPKKNVDFGGGLERILAAVHNEPDFFSLPIFTPIITTLEALSGKRYLGDEKQTKAFRVIADHLRAAVMLIADGVNPSNKDQGYVVRRLIRRAVRFAHVLGIEDLFLAQLVSSVTSQYQEPYPDIHLRHTDIAQTLNQEEGKFRRTLIKGEQQLKKMLAEKSENKLSNISAQDAFYLYESFGFPLELTQEIISEAHPEDKLVTSDDFSQAFQKLRQQHSSSSRTASAGQFKGGLQNSSQITTRYHTATHLLHASLRKQLGKQVQQKGSHITDQRLRFDFSYDRTIDQNVLQIVIDQINQWVQEDLPVHCQEMLKSDALKQGALAFFVEKYPEKVTVYTIGSDSNANWVSKELCGGPHVQQTGQIGMLEVIKEQAIGAGIRRIYLRFVE